jgi:hypothetical protein
MQSKKLIWLKKPKCAGTSFETALRKLGYIYYVNDDTTLRDLENPENKVICVRSGVAPTDMTFIKLEDGTYKKSYPRSLKSKLRIFFRKPFEPLVFMLKHHSEFWKNNISFTIIRNPYDKFISAWKYLEATKKLEINELLCAMPKKVKYRDFIHITQSQYQSIRAKDGEDRCNYFVYMEDNINESINHILGFVGLTTIKLSHERKTPRSSLDQYLTKEIAIKVASLFEDDFEYFGYSKDISNLHAVSPKKNINKINFLALTLKSKIQPNNPHSRSN